MCHPVDNGLSVNDLKYLEVSLHRTPRRGHYVAVQGGAASIAARRAVGGGWVGGTIIYPIDDKRVEKIRQMFNEQNFLKIYIFIIWLYFL